MGAFDAFKRNLETFNGAGLDLGSGGAYEFAGDKRREQMSGLERKIDNVLTTIGDVASFGSDRAQKKLFDEGAAQMRAQLNNEIAKIDARVAADNAAATAFDAMFKRNTANTTNQGE